MQTLFLPFIVIFKLIRLLSNSLINLALSLALFKTIKVYLSNHFSVGIYYLYKQNTHFPHPVGIVIGKNVRIGQNCTIYQNVTIGTKETKDPNNAQYPTIEENVTVYANSVIFGNITIGKNSVIGAGSVVFRDIPSNSLVVGNPCRILEKPSASELNKTKQIQITT